MKMRHIGLMLLVAVLTLTLPGCNSFCKKKDLDGGGQNIVIDESPVSGDKTDTQTKKLEVDKTLLETCEQFPVPNFGAGRPVDVNEVKRQETLIYVRCALRHNALVDFLTTKLGIVPVDMTKPAK